MSEISVKLNYVAYVEIGTQTIAESRTMEFGTVTSVSLAYAKSVSSTPIVSRTVDDTIQLESGNTLTYTIEFTRRSPPNWTAGYDSGSTYSDLWSNAYWEQMVSHIINRWQARTDGGTLSCASNDGQVPSFTTKGYIQSLSLKHTNKQNDMITGTMVFVAGTMHISSKCGTPTHQAYGRQVVFSSNSLGVFLPPSTITVPVNTTVTVTLPNPPASWTAYADSLTPRKVFSYWTYDGTNYNPLSTISIPAGSDNVYVSGTWV